MLNAAFGTACERYYVWFALALYIRVYLYLFSF